MHHDLVKMQFLDEIRVSARPCGCPAGRIPIFEERLKYGCSKCGNGRIIMRSPGYEVSKMVVDIIRGRRNA